MTLVDHGTVLSRVHWMGVVAGLAVVRRLCARFGGRAWAEGREHQGAPLWFAWLTTPRGA
ncbi:hypothetical protein GCM10017781_32430 [Deinococcus metalli]|uniref:ATP-binding protein n=1 Tax=Deinococcus metalli TaxID=1141878 RepID=A0ABQ3JQG1_9DEIO|nr:hypothetical protein GCM10017781_32430 [Deinococcus metalli]